MTGLAVLVVVLAVGIPFAYIHLGTKAAPALALPTGSSPAAAPTGGIDGTWSVGSGSAAGYRVGEVLLGQHTTAVGSTDAVTGQMTVTGSGTAAVPAARFSVDMTKVTSDRAQRDNQFRGRIMDTAQFPTSTFTLTRPLQISAAGVGGQPVTVPATGTLTLHGVTRTVTFPLQARRNGAAIDISGQIPVTFADYGVGNPSIGGFVTTDDHGTVEVLLHLTKQA